MRKTSLFVITLFVIYSCGSGTYKTKRLNVDNEGLSMKTYDLAEFDMYTYNICEDTRLEINNKRFNKCDENFYNLAETDSILKVEEVYLLRHRPSNVVIYLTTASNRYFRYKKGFLNDRKIYENKIILNKLEYAYIGKIDTESNWIHFPNQSGGQDVILHYDTTSFPEAIALDAANIATAENKYTTDEKIGLDDIFRKQIVYNRKNVEIQFYQNKIGDATVRSPKCLNIISRRGKAEIVFGCSDTDSLFFKISNRKVRYNTNYYILPK